MLGGQSDNETFNQVADKVAGLLQNEDTMKEGLKAVSKMSADEAPITSSLQAENITQVNNVISSRLSNGSGTVRQGMSSGDVAYNPYRYNSPYRRQKAHGRTLKPIKRYNYGEMWMQGIYNKAEFSPSNANGFDSKSSGMAFGYENYPKKRVKPGFGYAYTQTDVDRSTRDTDVSPHTVFGYGEYKPNNWFVNGIIGYTFSKYDEVKNVLGFNADYGVNAISLQAVSGYDYTDNGLTVPPDSRLALCKH